VRASGPFKGQKKPLSGLETPQPPSTVGPVIPQPNQRSPFGPRAGLLGIGFDHEDGHKRITTGDEFAIIGGSSETHDRMTETLMKTFEELKKRSKQLQQVGPKELAEIIYKATPH